MHTYIRIYIHTYIHRWMLDKPALIKDEMILLAANRGCDMLNETPFCFDRPGHTYMHTRFCACMHVCVCLYIYIYVCVCVYTVIC